MVDASAASSGGGRKVVMLGAPGSGKGTQAELLAESLEIPAISTGEMLRAAVAAGNELGERVKGVMASGALVSDELIAEIVSERLAASDAAGGFLLDGYPRTSPQADMLDRILEDRETELDHVIYLDVPDEELMTRALARKRADDKEEIVRERLRVYLKDTAPLIERYQSQGLVRHVNGHRPIESVQQELATLFQD